MHKFEPESRAKRGGKTWWPGLLLYVNISPGNSHVGRKVERGEVKLHLQFDQLNLLLSNLRANASRLDQLLLAQVA